MEIATNLTNPVLIRFKDGSRMIEWDERGAKAMFASREENVLYATDCPYDIVWFWRRDETRPLDTMIRFGQDFSAPIFNLKKEYIPNAFE